MPVCMNNNPSEIDRALRQAKRIVWLRWLHLVLVVVGAGILAAMAITSAVRIHRQLGGDTAAACLLGAVAAVMAGGAWLRARHGSKVFWMTLAGLSLGGLALMSLALMPAL